MVGYSTCLLEEELLRDHLDPRKKCQHERLAVGAVYTSWSYQHKGTGSALIKTIADSMRGWQWELFIQVGPTSIKELVLHLP